LRKEPLIDGREAEGERIDVIGQGLHDIVRPATIIGVWYVSGEFLSDFLNRQYSLTIGSKKRGVMKDETM